MVLLTPSVGLAAISLVQSATQVNGSATATTAPCVTLTGTVAGNYLALVGHVADGATGSMTITDTTDGTNTYTTRTGSVVAGSQTIYAVVAYAKIASNGSYTACINLANTSGGSNRYYSLGLQEWSGIAASSPEDTWDSNSQIDSSGSTDASAGPITTTDAGAVLLGVGMLEANDATANFSSPTSWTNAYRQNDGSTYYASDSAYWLPGSTQTTYTAQWSHDNGADYKSAGVIVALKAEGGGGGGAQNFFYLRRPQ